MSYLYITFVFIGIVDVKGGEIHKNTQSYFESDTVKTFEKKWNPYAFTYENAIAYTLTGDYGHKTMNVYINRLHSPLLISTGYYHSDNQVELVFKDIMLEALPHLYDIDISLTLPSNVVMLEASISRMILHTSYVLFRNKSDIIFSPSDQDPHKNSPFRFQQVSNLGHLAITVEGCTLSGVIVATLNGKSVNLGHADMKLTDCQYNFEIYKPGTGAPPVIVNYLPKQEIGLDLETLLTRPMVDELIPKLQGAIFSEINTSAILTDDLHKIRSKQEIFFDEAKNSLDQAVSTMNKKTMEKNMGTEDLSDFTIVWDDTFTELPNAKAIKLYKMTLLGLDTVHASHSGGPVRISEVEIIEQLRFSTLQVVGKILIEGFQENESEFAVEISDLAVDIDIDSAHKLDLNVLGWRFMEFSCPGLEFLPTEGVIIGYLLKEVPKHIQSHLKSVYVEGKINLNDGFEEVYAADGLSNEMLKEVANLHENVIQDFKDQGNIHLNDPDAEDKLHVKLHHVKVVPHTNENNPLNSKHKNLHLNDAKTEELNQVKLHHVGVQHHRDENQNVFLNDAGTQEYENVKLHHVGVQPHRDENQNVFLNDAGTQEYEKIKLHHVGVQPHRDENQNVFLNDAGTQEYEKVKLHHVGVQPHRDENQNVFLNDAGTQEYEKVKLHHVGVQPHRDENQNVFLNDAGTQEYEKVKLHHVGVQPHRDENQNVFLNDAGTPEYAQVKLHHVGVRPHKFEKSNVHLNDAEKQKHTEVKLRVGRHQKEENDPLQPSTVNRKLFNKLRKQVKVVRDRRLKKNTPKINKSQKTISNKPSHSK